MSTPVLKPSEVNRKWVVIDAADVPLGRVSTVIAGRLIGKYQPTYTPHVDSGDFVVVVNAEKVKLTGNKELDKTYYRHSGHPGGLKEKSAKEVREDNPTFLIEHAVKGMLPKNKLQSNRMNRLKIYSNEEHAHAAQKPVKLEI